jgi:hypothetical protein
LKLNSAMTVLIAVHVAVLGGCSEAVVAPTDELAVSHSHQPSPVKWGADHDLIQLAAHSFYTEGSNYFGPGLPGWQSVSGAGREGVWSAPELVTNTGAVEENTRIGSWLTGRAGSIRFPYPKATEAGATLQFWFFGLSTGQAVSVFLNGEIVETVDLGLGWSLYSMPLPALTAGEHRLRFWFRRMKAHKGKRTPGAIGQIRIGIDSKSAPWTTLDTTQTLRELPSQSGSVWSHYINDAAGAEVEAVLRTGETPVNAVISVTNDKGEMKVVCSAKVEAVSEYRLAGRLPADVEGAQRLSFKTSGHAHTAHWRSMVLRSRHNDQKLEIAPSLPKRILFVVLDSTTGAGLRLGRKGPFPLTPTADLLSSEGLALPFVFTGGDSLVQRVHRLLSWSLKMTKQRKERFRSALFSEVNFRLNEVTRDQMDRDVVRSPDEFSQMLEEIEMWVKLGGRQPLSVTVVLSGHPKTSLSEPATAVAENMTAKKTAGLSESQLRRMTYLDQKLGRLLGLFDYLDELENTLVVVLGHRELKAKVLDILAPDDFFSPMLIWTKGQDLPTSYPSMTPFEAVFDALEVGVLGKRSTPSSASTPASKRPVSHWARPLTSVLSGSWLLVLQDAKRYGLFRFEEGWSSFKQSQPITQRALRVLVDQEANTPR